MERASEEQLLYINDKTSDDSKLIATAGSGKTFSIVARAYNLINSKIYDARSVYVLTFSRQAKHDFVRKARSLKATLILEENIRTIDSFAKHIIDKDNNIDRSILSYSFREFLRSTSTVVLKTVNCLKDIKVLFVDEAQDLNQTQYDIIKILKDKLNVVIHLVGDPNQNIFQFRGGCDKYLVNYDCQNVYKLSKNYRSNKHLIEFSNKLQKYGDHAQWHSISQRVDAKVLMYGYRCNDEYETLLKRLLTRLTLKIPLHKIAILAPTLGYLSKQGNHKGLCYIANMLHCFNIPSQSLYDDMSEKHIEGGRICDETKDKITLMTYTASKGLEWDYVILIDANAYLISKQNYSIDKYNEEQYLLYVACTRAKKGLYIFSKMNEGNSWFHQIPNELYNIANPLVFNLKNTNEINFTPSSNEELSGYVNISSLVFSLGEETLFDINGILDAHVTRTGMFLDTSIPRINNNKTKFAYKFLKLVFQFKYACINREPRPKLHRIEGILNSSNIIFCENSYITYWFEKNKFLGWDNYDELVKSRKVRTYVQTFIEENVPRSKDMECYVLISDKFYQSYILSNKETILENFRLYNCIDDDNFLETLLFLSSLDYAILTMHYFYILEYKNIFGELIEEKYKNHINNIINSVTYFPTFESNNNIYVEYKPTILDEKMNGSVDYVLNGHSVFITFSSSTEIKLQDKMNFLLHDYMLRKTNNPSDEVFTSVTLYNLASGIFHTIEAVMDNTIIERICKTLC